ncbi:putative disease resistance protein RGA1 [Coffea eugenioides]|uniref:putative disease resistance protein RGA1 n=1 Tax=Coffea eugenioides TaxID=49369 RepID=UPI000F60EB15|nr:putative disease resistance protein RGA1 [Coffea eugenioides]
MPSGIGKLTCLRTLSMVVLSGKKGFRLSELRDLNMLRGELSIEHLERIKDKKDAEEACLIKKQSLRELRLHWHFKRMLQRYNDEEVLEALKPCPNLQLLSIQGFKGSSLFPSWISTVTEVLVRNSATEYIVGPQESTATTPGVKKLTLQIMPNLKGMLRREVQGTLGVFSQLQSLSFFNCPTLTLPLPHMPSLKELCVDSCPNMAWASISNLTSLNSLRIEDIEGLSCFPEEMLQNLSLLESLGISDMKDLQALPRSLASLTALKMLAIVECPKLESLPEEGLRGLASLQELSLFGCYNLVSLSMGTKALKSLTHLSIDGSNATALPEEVKHFPALQKLELIDFHNLTSLPDWFGGGHLTSLQDLTLWSCPKLETLPSSIQMMKTLQSLTIRYCSLLGPRCERGGEEWHKIKHIPNLELIAEY